MTNDVIPSDVLAQQLGVSERTLKYLTDLYSEVYGALPRPSPESHQRLFPLVAVERLIAARQMAHDTPGMSTLRALTALRDGATPLHSLEPVPNPDVLAQVYALQTQVNTLQTEMKRLRTLVQDFTGQHGLVPPGAPLQPASATAQEVCIDLSTDQRDPAYLQPGLTRLLANLEAGYTLREIRGRTVLLTASGQQVRLVNPRMVTSLIEEGWLVREGDSYHTISC